MKTSKMLCTFCTNVLSFPSKGGSRRKKMSTVRARIAKWGVDKLGLSMAEIAQHVGVTTSNIARAVVRLEKEG